MPIERLYDRLYPSCATVNELNRLHILLDNRMTPTDAARLAAHIPQAYGRGFVSRQVDAVRVLGAKAGGRLTRRRGARAMSDYERRTRAIEWAGRLDHHLRLATAKTPSPIARRWLRGGAAYYQATGTPSTVLTIGFTGNARRLMMPAPQFLQHLHPFATDLLLLDGRRGSAYADGVRGFSTDFPGTVAWLREFARGHGATQLVTVGTSGGGFPALLAGLALPAASVLAVGAVIRGAGGYGQHGAAADLAEVVAQYDVSVRAPRVALLYGRESTMDAEAARALADVLPDARVLPVEDVGHGCLYPLAERGRLESVLADTLFADRPVAGRAP